MNRLLWGAARDFGLRVIAVALGQHDFAAMLGRLLTAKQSTGELQAAYDYWILGEGAVERPPRWSIGKDVLGWWED